MLVTQSIESNLNILAKSPTAENIISILEGMPYDYYNCQNITDAFMIPCFILIVDGNILTKDNQDIDVWECYLIGWTGRMKKCLRCRNYRDCSKEIPADAKDIDNSPKHAEPIILLHADKRQREVEGLISLIPPMPVHETFSEELKDWLKSTCLFWQKRALKWREEFEQWDAILHQKYLFKQKQKTCAEVAAERWRPRKINIKLPEPDFERK